MARWRVFAFLVPLAALMVLGQAAVGRPSSPDGVQWRGRTSQHLPLSFHVSAANGHRIIDAATFDFDLSCPAGPALGVGVGIGGPIAGIRGGAFRLAETNPFEAMAWSGTISRLSASGEVEFALPTFDPQGLPQRCDTGRLGWAALRDGAAAPAPSERVVHVSYVMDTSGVVRVTITER